MERPFDNPRNTAGLGFGLPRRGMLTHPLTLGCVCAATIVFTYNRPYVNKLFFDDRLLVTHDKPTLTKLTSRRTDEEYVAIGPTLGNRHQWWANFYRQEHSLSLRFDELLNNVTYSIKIRFCDFDDLLYEVRSLPSCAKLRWKLQRVRSQRQALPACTGHP